MTITPRSATTPPRMARGFWRPRACWFTLALSTGIALWTTLWITLPLAGCAGNPGSGSPLGEAAARGDVGRIRKLLGAGASPDERDRLGFSALQTAARCGQLQVIRLLVDSGADANLRSGRNDWTPLLHAIHKHQVDAVVELLRVGADVDATTAYGLTPLMMAAGYGQTDIVEILLAHGADVWKANKHGETALALAVSGVTDIDAFTIGDCQEETVRALLEHAPQLREHLKLRPLTRVKLALRCRGMASLLREPGR